MSQLKKNVLANLVGRGWTMAASLALTPLYIKFMGLESMGLIGVYQVLDMKELPDVAWLIASSNRNCSNPNDSRSVANTKTSAW